MCEFVHHEYEGFDNMVNYILFKIVPELIVVIVTYLLIRILFKRSLERNTPKLYDMDGVPKEPAKALEWYLARQDNVKAQFNLGMMCEAGFGTKKNITDAMKWLRKAANQGDALAADRISYFYHDGIGVKADSTESAKWCRIAAESGYANAQNYLGMMYEDGDGVPKDIIQAYMWNTLAAAQNNIDAIGVLKRLEKKMTKDQIADGKHLSNEWRQKHQ
jgi:TPR repeat protein